MERPEKLRLMMERFVHPNSTFAEQYYADGSGKMKQGTHYIRRRVGECTHTPRHTKRRECDGFTDEIFTETHLAQHLTGKKTFGPYQVQDGKIKWLCLDIDAYEGIDQTEIEDTARAVAKNVYVRFGVDSFLVEQSGSKGYHVWLFFDTPLGVEYGFTLGHQLVDNIKLHEHIIVEVYPKSTSPRGVGSTVKLPLGIHQKTGQRCLFVDNTFTPHEDQWAKLRDVRLLDAAEIERTVTPTVAATSDSLPKGVSHVPLCLVEIMQTGAQKGIRDEAAFRLACYYRDKGIAPDLAWTMLLEWNKKNTPPLDEDVLRVKHESGYDERNYSWRPCTSPSFDKHCQSSCVFFKRKVEQRWSGNPNNPIGVICRE